MARGREESYDGPDSDTQNQLSALERYQNIVNQPNYVDKLKAAQQNYATPKKFKEGDIVEWKPSMRMAPGPYPTYSAPMVVVRMLDEPAEISSSVLPLWEVQRYDTYIGFIDGDGDFNILRADSACLQKWHADPAD